jgi:hypothetical protein
MTNDPAMTEEVRMTKSQRPPELVNWTLIIAWSMVGHCWGIGHFSCCASEPIAIKVEGDRIDFQIGGERAASYHVGATQIKPYLWPVVAPNGAVVTRGWPMEKAAAGGSIDHIHQKSGWLTYGDVIAEGMEVNPKRPGVTGVDFWIEVPVHGRIACVRVEQPQDGRVVTRNEWRAPGGQVVLEETRSLSLHDLGVGRLIIVECDWHAAHHPVVFGDTKEGMFGVRVNDQLRTDMGKGKPVPEGNAITNSNGKKGEGECWGRLADWCDYSGVIDGKSAGVAIFDDPANPHRACWHVRGYGLMAANPFGRAKSNFPDRAGKTETVRLAKGDHLKLRYGLYAHDGDVKTGKVAEAFARFVAIGKS